MPPKPKVSGGVIGGADSGPRASGGPPVGVSYPEPTSAKPHPVSRKPVPSGDTGRANALTRGQGMKVGLRRQMGVPLPAPVTPRPMVGTVRPSVAGFVPSIPDKPKPSGGRPAPKGKKSSLTGRALALTRGKGKKIGLRKAYA